MEEEERKDRVKKKKKMEERSKMVRWLTHYLEANSDRLEMEEIERSEIRRKRLSEQDKAARFKKIEIIGEKERNEKFKNEKEEIVPDYTKRRGDEVAKK